MPAEMTERELSDAEINARIAERIFGWHWFEAPQFDANGPLPEQGKVLCPPGMPCPGYEWPRVGVIHPHFFLNGRGYRFTDDPDASKRLRDRMAELGWSWSLDFWIKTGERHYDFTLARFPVSTKGNQFKGQADTEEMSVALCALKVVE